MIHPSFVVAAVHFDSFHSSQRAMASSLSSLGFPHPFRPPVTAPQLTCSWSDVPLLSTTSRRPAAAPTASSEMHPQTVSTCCFHVDCPLMPAEMSPPPFPPSPLPRDVCPNPEEALTVVQSPAERCGRRGGCPENRGPHAAPRPGVVASTPPCRVEELDRQWHLWGVMASTARSKGQRSPHPWVMAHSMLIAPQRGMDRVLYPMVVSVRIPSPGIPLLPLLPPPTPRRNVLICSIASPAARL